MRRVSSTIEDSRFLPVCAHTTLAPRVNSSTIAVITPAASVNAISEKNVDCMSSPSFHGRSPAIISTTAVTAIAIDGSTKLRRIERSVVERHASSGPMPVRNSRNSPMGMFTRL